MELAERIDEKRPSVAKSDTHESSLTTTSKAQPVQNIRPFVITTFVGVFLLLTGGLLFLYQNVMGSDEQMLNDETGPTQETRRELVYDRNQLSNSNPHQIWLIVALTLIGIGAMLVAIGSVIVVTSSVRYRLSRDSERYPILEKSSEMNPMGHPSTITEVNSTKRRKPKKRTASWMKNTTRSLSREGFRFAAHRHPSVNPIPIDGSDFFFHKLSEHSTSSSSEERLEKLNESNTKIRVGEFLRRILRWKNSNKKDRLEDPPDDSSLQENDLGRFISTRDSEYYTDHCHLYECAGGGSESTSTHSGLYNLEQE